jgi:hypothetical protein
MKLCLLITTGATFLATESNAAHPHHRHQHHAHVVGAANRLRFAEAASSSSSSSPSGSSSSSSSSSAEDDVAGYSYGAAEQPGPCWVIGESADCCPKGFVESGRVEACAEGRRHGSSLMSRHCKVSLEHTLYDSKKKRAGRRAVCSNDASVIQQQKDEAEATAKQESDMAAAARQQQADDEVAAANAMLSSPAPAELCRAFQSQSGLCAAAGCSFVGTQRMIFRSADLTANCNMGCCPTGETREGTAPTPGVCASLRSNAVLCAQAGCIHRAAPTFQLQSRSTCIVPGSDTGADGSSGGAKGSTDGDVRLMDENQLPGEDVDINSVNTDASRMARLKEDVVAAEQQTLGKTPADPSQTNPNPVVTTPVREKIIKGIKSIRQWVVREKHGCRTGLFAKLRGQAQPETCQACVQSSVGGLFTSSNLCSWCALDGHSSTIGFCAASAHVCHQVQTKHMAQHFGENVAFTTAISHYNAWQCPDVAEAQVRSCKRGCALRCEVEAGKKDWAQQQKRPSEAKCIAPEGCEAACKTALPDQLERLMFEERVARTVPAMMTNVELCIRGCTDRKVGFGTIETGLHEWEFEEVESSQATCLDQCELTIRGTIRAEKQVAMNDAELGAAGSAAQEQAGVATADVPQ